MSRGERTALEVWACAISLLFAAASFGVVGLAVGHALWGSGALDGARSKDSVVFQMPGGGEGSRPSAPPTAAPPVVLDLDVNAVGAPAGAAAGQAGPPVSVNVAGATASAQASSGAETKDNDVPAPVETAANPCDAPCPFCRHRAEDPRPVPGPCAYAELLGRVEFQTGRRKILASHAERLEEIANALDARTGVLLVIGHTDSCGGSRLARRRAKKVRKALRGLLKRRSAWRGWERVVDNRIHSQAAGEDPRAPEGSCEAKYYRSAAVYLIENLS